MTVDELVTGLLQEGKSRGLPCTLSAFDVSHGFDAGTSETRDPPVTDPDYRKIVRPGWFDAEDLRQISRALFDAYLHGTKQPSVAPWRWRPTCTHRAGRSASI